MNAMPMKVKQFVFALALSVVVLPHLVLAGSLTATYRVTFTQAWSNKMHPPADFQAHAFSSPLIGGVHRDRVTYWIVGELASPGIELMAEEGIPDCLASEVKADISRGRALGVLSSPATNDSPGSNTIASLAPVRPLWSMAGRSWFSAAVRPMQQSGGQCVPINKSQHSCRQRWSQRP
jgi:spondin N